jgi:hypothetical protein
VTNAIDELGSLTIIVSGELRPRQTDPYNFCIWACDSRLKFHIEIVLEDRRRDANAANLAYKAG